MSFYVFYGTPRQRARVHDADCVHCRHGQGQENQDKTGSGATGWKSPYSTLDEARDVMNYLRYADSGLCNTCLGGP
jgi:hypothetical protein